jgi:hypothetical protein
MPVGLTIHRLLPDNLPGVIPEIDIWRVANLMLKRYGDEADIESAIRAEELADAGDWAGEAIWRRVMGAVRQLVNLTPPGRYTEGRHHEEELLKLATRWAKITAPI